jgi:hypothetical protein
MVEAHQREPIRILAYCILSNHWHFVVWTERDGQLSNFFRWLAHARDALARLAPNRGVRASLALSGGDPTVTMNGSGKRSRHLIRSTPSVGRVSHAKGIDPTPIRGATPRVNPAAK